MVLHVGGPPAPPGGDRVRGPEESYGDFSNCAVAQADPKTDSVTFEFASPVPYAVDGVPYPPHIHFTRLLSDDIWDTRIWSMNVPPMMSRQETARCIRSSDYLVLNALPVHALQGQHIPGTARLPYELTLSSIGRLLHSRVKNDTPLVLYCAGPRCNASHVLMEKLLALGYTNLLLYPGGLEEWGASQLNRTAPTSARAAGGSGAWRRTARRCAGDSDCTVRGVRASTCTEAVGKGPLTRCARTPCARAARTSTTLPVPPRQVAVPAAAAQARLTVGAAGALVLLQHARVVRSPPLIGLEPGADARLDAQVELGIADVERSRRGLGGFPGRTTHLFKSIIYFDVASEICAGATAGRPAGRACSPRPPGACACPPAPDRA